LAVGGQYPKWGTENRLTEEGAVFFRDLDSLSFGTQSWPSAPVFIDETTMPKRHDDELSASPDWTLVFEDRVWIIELKTERGSHRITQLPHYLELAAHHFPGRAVDITYLTGPLKKPAPELRAGQRNVHLMWDDVLPLYGRAWGESSDPRIHRYLDVLQEALGALVTPWNEWRSVFAASVPPPTHPDPLGEALRLVDATASDHQQRALEFVAQGAQDLHDLRLEIRDALRVEPEDSPRRHVQPWVWTWKSLGQPLTDAGREQGAELRVSFYSTPVN
jgi:hypothetical protein